MSPDRLEALRRQRALVAQHLAWLDSEIAASAPTSAPLPLRAPTTAPASPAHRVAAVEPTPTVVLPPPPDEDALAAANARADEIIAQHATSDRFDPKGARRGCILLASAVFLLGLAGAMFAYLLYYNK